MAQPTPDDIGTAGWFSVKLDGGDVSEETWFREVKGLDIEITSELVDEGGKNDGQYKLPGPAKFSNIILKRGVSKSQTFVKWVTSSVNRQYKRVTGTISVQTRDKKPILEWKFVNAWPCRYSGPTMDAVTHEIAFEEIEIAHEGLTLQAGAAAP